MPLPQYTPQAQKPQDPLLAEKERLHEHTKDIPLRIGIHAGKGGVGKTFFATQIALLLTQQGKNLGLIDADVDCPNVPFALNIHTELDMTADGKIIPAQYKDIKIVSSGFMQPDKPIIIRGPIKHRLLTDFIERVDWGALDALVFDFPPGTSDVPLSAMQVANLTGVFIITTPTPGSIADAKRAIHMAKQFGVHIYGLIENMSGEVFGQGAGQRLAEEENVPFICSLPLQATIRENAEEGNIIFQHEQITSILQALQ